MRAVKMLLVFASFLMLLPASALAQQGQITGTVRDSSGGVVPGVLVEATSPALIEKVRSATSDSSGQYRITNLPVGTYSVTFTLEGFSKQQQNNVVADDRVHRVRQCDDERRPARGYRHRDWRSANR